MAPLSDARKQQMREYYAKRKYSIRQQQGGYYIRNRNKLKAKYKERREDRLKYFKEHRAKEKEIRANIRQKARESRPEWNKVVTYTLPPEPGKTLDKPIWS